MESTTAERRERDEILKVALPDLHLNAQCPTKDFDVAAERVTL